MRMVESSGATKWPSSMDAATFVSPLKNMAAEELGLLLNGHRLHGDQSDMVPNRSGSAPPSMEGSFAAIGNLMTQRNNLDSSLASLSSAIENSESEEQLRSDPAYFAYYCSNVNLNPRLPPPLISRENQRLVRHIGGFGNNWRLTSFDDSGNGSLHLSRGSLSTHKEESEDDRSPRQTSDDWPESSSAVMPGQKTASSAGRHKSLVDLIQEDFPRTPSPVYNQSRSSSHAATEELLDLDVHAISLNDSSLEISKLPEPGPGTVDVSASTCTLDAPAIGLMPNKDDAANSFPSSSYSDRKHSSLPLTKDESSDKGGAGALVSGGAGLEVSRVESKTKASNVSSLLVAENNANKQEQKPSYERNMPPHHPYAQQSSPYKVQGVQAQVISQGMSHPYNGMEKLPHAPPKFSSVELQPMMQSPGLTPPLYATAAAYIASGSPFYPNIQPSGLFAPQYGMGGYGLSSALVPQFIGGYPSPAAIPMPFDATSGPSFNVRTTGASMGESIPHELQNLNKFYGHHGLMLQPSFLDPLHMQYFQHPFEDAYGAAGQYGRLPPRGVIGGQDSSVSQKESHVSAYMGDQKLQPPTNGSLSVPSPRKGGIMGSSYYGSPPNMGVMTQFPASPLSSPILPGSPVGGTNHPGRRNEMRFPQGPIRNVGVYSGWQGQRGADSFEDPKKHSFLEELKSNNARKFELSDITGRTVEFSVDQHGSRFIQQKLENCSGEEKVSVFKEVLPHASRLMTDVFGNYVIQKFFEHGTPEQRRELAYQLAGQMIPLSLQMYGCRVIQKALEVIELDQKTQLVHELDGHVIRCVRDQNGNHVIQKCIECIPTEKIGFIISAFKGQVTALSSHPYGCRVIQRVLEHCSEVSQSQFIVDEILESAYVLAEDQYGNYVTQHVLERGNPHERSQIISKLTGKIVQMSQHKYASNVIEKCLEYGSTSECELLTEEIIGQSEDNDNLLVMMKDQFANYVVQKILETSNDKQREILLNRIRVHLNALKKYTYGKHIVARFEQLCCEESPAPES